MRHVVIWNAVRWLGLLFELYSLFVFVNAAFLVPYPYDGKRVVFVVLSASTAGAFAFLSSVGTVKLSTKGGKQLKRALHAAPSVAWAFVIFAGCVMLFIHAVAP